MKKFYFLISICLITSSLSAQNRFETNLAPSTAATLPYAYAPQNTDITLTWLTSQVEVGGYGNSAGTISTSFFMELNTDDCENFKVTGKSPKTVKEIHFYLSSTSYSVISSAKVVIRQGASLATSAETYQQAVTGLHGGWNLVTLTSEYTINPASNIYIGYQVTTSSAGNPASVAYGNNPKQAWLINNNNQTIDNTAASGYEFMIKAISSADDSYANGVALQSLTISDYAIINNSINVSGVVRNYGSQPLTSFTVNYTADGVSSTPYQITGINLPVGGTYTFTHNVPYQFTSIKVYPFTVTISMPNGDANGIGNPKTFSTNVKVCDHAVQRVVLHESFTSSTCNPCKEGNENLIAVLNAVDANKWVNIRYQMSWPSTGDPYYTQEGGIKRTFYSVNSVPELEIDGNRFNGDPYYHSVAIFNQLAAIPAAAAFAGDASVSGKTVTANITFTPATNMNAADLRFFAAVVERQTSQNRKTNGETQFLNVMKKFLTSANGNTIGNLVLNTPQNINLSYTFNGNYRLPAAAINSSGTYIGINHATEHSVENFGNLMVVAWVQNIVTGEVLQSGKFVATQVTAVDNSNTNELSAYIAGNTLFINSETAVENVTIYDVAGKIALQGKANRNQMLVGSLSKGIYLVKITTEGTDYIQKVAVK